MNEILRSLNEEGLRNFRDLIERRAAEFGKDIFIFCGNDEISFRDFDNWVNRAGNVLLNAGAKKGDVVAILMSNRLEFYYFFFGALKIGAVCSPVNRFLKAPEIEYQLNNCQAGLLISEKSYEPVITRISNKLPFIKRILLLDGEREDGVNLNRMLKEVENKLPSFSIDRTDDAAIFYTSGTTGFPKGVLLTHENYLAEARTLALSRKLGRSNRSLIMSPLFFAFAMNNITCSNLDSGGSIVLTDAFHPKEFWQTVSRYRITTVHTVPTMISIMLGMELPAGLDVSCLRVVTVAGSSIEQIRAFEEKFRVKVTHGYGLTESVAASCSNPIEGKRKNKSVGFPYMGMEMEIFNEQDEPLPQGQIGEIVQRGPLVMKGYFNNPKATAEALRGGWLHTGDLGYKDEDGYFYLVDRKKEMIRRGGQNVYPREIERVLYTHPKIKEAAVIGIPDVKYGEEIKAVILPKDGVLLDEEEVRKYCQENLADYKCPKKIEFLQEMPLTGSGKIDKKELRRREREGEN